MPIELQTRISFDLQNHSFHAATAYFGSLELIWPLYSIICHTLRFACQHSEFNFCSHSVMLFLFALLFALSAKLGIFRCFFIPRFFSCFQSEIHAHIHKQMVLSSPTSSAELHFSICDLALHVHHRTSRSGLCILFSFYTILDHCFDLAMCICPLSRFTHVIISRSFKTMFSC